MSRLLTDLYVLWGERSHEVLYWLLSMSIMGTLTGAIIWLLGRWKRMPRRLAHALWIAAGLRLLVPVGLRSRFSLGALLPDGAARYVPLPDGSLPYFPVSGEQLTMTNALQLADAYSPLLYRSARVVIVLDIAFLIWAAGLMVLAALVLLAWVANRRESRSARLLSGRIYASDAVAGPAVYGVFRPRILIPEQMANSPDLSLALAHEQAHIRRWDNLWRALALFTACVHWFNPAAWLMLRACLREAELACDEHVAARLSAPERKAYAHMLLNAAQTRLPLISPLGGSGLRTRVKRIMSYRRMTIAGTAAFALLAAAIAWALLSNPL